MAVQLINIGNVANDGTGDDLREAFIKTNANFEELDLRDDEQTTVSNLGEVGEGLFAQKLVYDLQFKKLVAGQNVLLTPSDQSISIGVNVGVKQVSVVADTGGTFYLYDNADITFAGGNDISIDQTSGTVTVSYSGVTDLASDTTPQLTADLDAQTNNLLNVGTITTSGVTGPVTGNVTGDILGNVTGLVNGIDVRTLLSSSDFGGINSTVTNILEYIIYNTDVEWGTIVDPGTVSLDAGPIAV
jgi:hypothetical protein|tara:strand:+ start:4155 stop:4886 length:732 start_codon:yes stop_codon:yes gene_type:complete